jgi:hypothetical protein
MILPVFWLAAAAQAPIVASAPDPAVKSCRSVIAAKLRLNIGPLAVASKRHSKGWTIVQGSFSGYRPPAAPAPGMAAPLHIIDRQFVYRCWLRNGSVRRVWTRKVGE